MQMVCPECNSTQTFEQLPMQLQTCPECSQDGTDTYLEVPTLELRQPLPVSSGIGRAVLERRRLVG
jgi:hypothetical protein